MNKAIMAVVVGAIAAAGVATVAEAQSPTTTPAAVTAEAAIVASSTAIGNDGRAGLISSGELAFSFTPAGLTCPAGTTNPAYCADNVSGGFRFIIRVDDLRPTSKSSGKSVVIGAFLSLVHPGVLFNSLTCLASNPNATAIGDKGCPLTIRANGLAILTYAVAHDEHVRVQLIAHIRPHGTPTSTEVIQFLNL